MTHLLPDLGTYFSQAPELSLGHWDNIQLKAEFSGEGTDEATVVDLEVLMHGGVETSSTSHHDGGVPASLKVGLSCPASSQALVHLCERDATIFSCEEICILNRLPSRATDLHKGLSDFLADEYCGACPATAVLNVGPFSSNDGANVI